MKKWVSNTINGVLGVLIVALIGLEIDIMVTSSQNHNVPSLFGYSFMQVLTDSMDGDRADSFGTGSGVIMQKVAPEDVKVDDVITFSETIESQDIVVSHRVHEVMLAPAAADGSYAVSITSSEQYRYKLNGGSSYTDWAIADGSTQSWPLGTLLEVYLLETSGAINASPAEADIKSFLLNAVSGEYTFYTTGDNQNSSSCGNNHQCVQTYRDEVKEDKLIGRVIAHSDFLGGLIGIARSTWFIPVAVLVPLLIIAILSLVDYFKANKKEKAEEEAKIQAALKEAGVDPSDEKAVILFTEKTRYKLELQETLEKEKEKEKKRLLKEMAKNKAKE